MVTFPEELTTKEEYVDYKIDLLYDFSILRMSKAGRVQVRDDKREPLIRKILEKFNAFDDMSRAIHDMLMEKETADEFIIRMKQSSI